MNKDKEIIIIVQCHIVKEHCSGYFCEYFFTNRLGKFDIYPKNKNLRIVTLTCGGCCGRALGRKLSDYIKRIIKREKIGKDKIMVHLASCIAFDSYHGPTCPHINYLKTIIEDKLGLDLIEGSRISKLSEKRREEGIYSQHEDEDQLEHRRNITVTNRTLITRIRQIFADKNKRLL